MLTGLIIDPHVTDGAGHYEIVTSALAEAQRYIQSFDINGCAEPGEEPGLPVHVFEGANETSIGSPRPDVLALAQLRCLSLTVAASKEEPWPIRDSDENSDEENSVSDYVPDISALPMLLGSMSNLTHLSLQMPCAFLETPVYYNYGQVFPKGTQWDKLESVTLQFLEFTESEFVDFVTKRMPNLRRLTLASLDLLEGTWEYVFQALSEMYPPPTLDFLYEDDNYLTQCEGESLWETYWPSSLFKNLSRYVTKGDCRHPCLKFDLEVWEAAEFFPST